MPQPISVRRQEAHRARSTTAHTCHAYPEDRSQGCYCNLQADHNSLHACACANRWT